MNIHHKKSLRSWMQRTELIKIALSAVYISMIFLPLLSMLSKITWANVQKVVSSANFASTIGHSVLAAVLSTAITVTLAYALAVCTERVDLKARGLFSLLLTLPMLIPSISHGMGLILLFGNHGILTELLGMHSGIYGLKGIVIGSVLYSFPVAYLMLANVMRYQDSSPYEAARVLGMSRWKRFTAITIPYMKKPLISAIFATFSLVITDYGVPLMVGGKYMTVSVVMYQEVIGQLDFGKGSVYGCILLIPALIAFAADLVSGDTGNADRTIRTFERSRRPAAKFLANCFCTLVSLCAALPIISFVILGFTKNYPHDLSFTLKNIGTAWNLGMGRFLLNSLVIAFFASCIGVAIAFLTAYMSARMKSRTSSFLHLSAITSAAIPGIVLGLSYVLAFKGSFIYGTILILVLVNVVHFISSPYLMAYNALTKINENLESVGSTLGIGRVHMVMDVFFPMCKNTLLEMFSYFFVNCMMTISAVSFLATSDNRPVSLMINQFETQMQLECAAIVSLAILLVDLLVKALAAWIGRTRNVKSKGIIEPIKKAKIY